MSLRSLQRNWQLFGSTDPFWAIITDPLKKGNRWDVDEFFRTGVDEAASILALVEAVRPLPEKLRALDFGCGAGRITQALGAHFAEILGVDIAPSMIALAERHNRLGDRCRYLLNTEPDLRIFPDRHFDLIYSVITLQHMPPHLARGYLKEFLRVLRPEGALLFQVPARLKNPPTLVGRAWAEAYRTWLSVSRSDVPHMDMFGIEKEAVLEYLGVLGARVLSVTPDQRAGPAWESYTYVVITA
ncbi:MAG: class I SAM-dependent methyltransferase [Acidobacteriota bacterium]|nr:class I SAM-dependent methyltransferase [Acidobacteriota bacterium]